LTALRSAVFLPCREIEQTGFFLHHFRRRLRDGKSGGFASDVDRLLVGLNRMEFIVLMISTAAVRDGLKVCVA